MSATFDPGNLVNITLSNGDMTATMNESDGNWRSAFATLQQTTGKRYFEVGINALAVGLCIGLTYVNTQALPVGLYSSSISAFNHIGSSSGVIQNTIIGSIGSPPFTTGDLVGVAVDLDAQLIWFYNPQAAQWNGDTLENQNPSTGAGGFSTAGVQSSPPNPGVSLLGTGDVVTINMAGPFLRVDSGFLVGVPAGFDPWDPDGGVSLLVSGNTASGTVGTMSIPNNSLTRAVTGNRAASRVANLSVAGASLTLATHGNTAAGRIGQPSVSGAPIAVALSGTHATGRIGTPSSARAVKVIGNAGTSRLGTVSSSPVTSRALSGNRSSGHLGNVSVVNGNITVGLGGNRGVSQLRSLAQQRVTHLTARAATAVLGTLAPNLVQPIGAARATGRLGTLALSRPLALTGLAKPTRIGTLAFVPSTGLSGNAAHGRLGTPGAAPSAALSQVTGRTRAGTVHHTQGGMLVTNKALSHLGTLVATRAMGIGQVHASTRLGRLGVQIAPVLQGVHSAGRVGQITPTRMLAGVRGTARARSPLVAVTVGLAGVRSTSRVGRPTVGSPGVQTVITTHESNYLAIITPN